MDFNKLIQTLHPLERKVLPVLTSSTTIQHISSATKLHDVEILRALQWLASKQIIHLTISSKEIILLGDTGKEFLTKNFPERRVLMALSQGPLSTQKLPLLADVTLEELTVSIGILKTNRAILTEPHNGLTLQLTDHGKQLLQQKLSQEIFLQKKFPLEVSTLSPHEKKLFETLKKRKQILQTELHKDTKITLLPLGKKLQEQKSADVIDRLTPDILKNGTWKGKDFRRYDLHIEAPKKHAGKLHHYRTFLDTIREQFITLGFTEMTGPIVETEFWNMDALYMPQFHSARDIHDVYFIKEPKYAPVNSRLVKNVKESHEKGVAGSTGWKYAFNEQRTQRTILRSQGTACTSRMLASPDLKIPGKYFGITRCFRKDVIDATHLPDFNQTEGMVIEQGLTLKHLFGLLRLFAKEFTGAQEIKLVPAYFPFTEPSVELYAKHPYLGWIELGGAGMARPEIIVPLLGKYVPAIMWGIGIDRIAMFKLGLKDIRALFSSDLEFLRNTPVMV